MSYKPLAPFNVPFHILSATQINQNGVVVNTFVESSTIYFCSAKAWVGSPKKVNDLQAEEDRLTVDCYYIPTLKRKDRIKLLDDNSVWELNVTPENIDRRCQYSKFTVVRIIG